MSQVRDKFNEARYFLNRLVELQPDRDGFRHNLSAYLTACRSVTDVMRQEYGNAGQFDTWWSTRLEALRADPLSAFDELPRSWRYSFEMPA